MFQALKRIEKELAYLNKQDVFFSVGPIDYSNMFEWLAQLPGPKDSPYEGGIFDLNIKFPTNYPYHPPKVEFMTRIYHPCIQISTGRKSFDFLFENWNPDFRIYDIILKIQNGLKNPDIKHNIWEKDIANQYEVSREEFEKTAREWTKRYADNYNSLSEEASEDEELTKIIIKFNYEGYVFAKEGYLEDQLKNVVNRSTFGNFMNKNSIICLYYGLRLNTESFISDIITITDKDRKEMNIRILYPILNNQDDNNNNLDNSKIKSKEVICPKCFEQSNIKI